MSFAAGDRLWGRGTATATTSNPEDDGFLDFSQALDHVERKTLPVYKQLWFWAGHWYSSANKFFQGPAVPDLEFEARTEPDFVPAPPPRALFDEEAFMSSSPPGISTPVTGLLMAVFFVTALVQGGVFAAVFILAMGAMLTALYVLGTGRASWARVPSKKIAFLILGGSLLAAWLCKIITG